VRSVPRADNANGARAKTRAVHVLPVTAALVLARLYSEYLHTEYGALDSDYVFVNLSAGPKGEALRYSAVADLVGRITARTGIAFLVRRGMPFEVAPKLLTHRSVATTADAYVHLGVEDVRAELIRRGVWRVEEAR